MVKDAIKEIDTLRASASLPFLSRLVKLNGKNYLDGGVSDPIPLDYSIKKGNTKNIAWNMTIFCIVLIGFL